MGMSKDDKREMANAIHRGKGKTVYELEEIIDMLAVLDDKGHSRKRVYLESADGSERIPISFIELDSNEGVVIIG